MLELAATGRLTVRREPAGLGLRLLYVSDLHLTPWHGHVVEQVLDQIRALEPELVLLGGDLVDLRSGLPLLSHLVQRLEAPFEAVPGNHDRFVGLQAIERVLGQPWLTRVTRNGIHIDGTPQPDGHVLVAHEPTLDENYRYVLAGHLHGSQFVLREHKGLLYPGAWFYRWNGDRFQRNKTTLLVSRGVNDTLPLRWNCPRDVILLEGP